MAALSLAGVLVDRLDRCAFMIAADLARAALAFVGSAPLAFGLAVAPAAAGASRPG